MANLSISEYQHFGSVAGHPAPVGQEPALTDQNVTFSGTSVQSAAFNDASVVVRVVSDVDARILFGANPTSLAADSKLLPAGNVEYFGVMPGSKVAVITAA